MSKLIHLFLLVTLVTNSCSDTCISTNQNQNSRRLTTNCDGLATSDDRFICKYNESKKTCEEVSRCNANYLGVQDCSSLPTTDSSIFDCVKNSKTNRCEESYKTCDKIKLDDKSPYLKNLEDICEDAKTSDDKKYECVVSSNKKGCQEQPLDSNYYIKTSKLIGLLGLLFI